MSQKLLDIAKWHPLISTINNMHFIAIHTVGQIKHSWKLYTGISHLYNKSVNNTYFKVHNILNNNFMNIALFYMTFSRSCVSLCNLAFIFNPLMYENSSWIILPEWRLSLWLKHKERFKFSGFSCATHLLVNHYTFFGGVPSQLGHTWSNQWL